jgi:hypothetical protein
MIYGASYSKFEVYTDSGLGTLTETININYNLGSFSGVSGESQNTPMKRRDLKYENPFTFSKTRVFVGYHYDAVLNIESGDHYYPGAVSQAEDFAAEQATPRETDVHKAFRLVDYANANYYILFTPHVDQAYVYGFSRYYVDLEIVGFSHGDTVRADKCQLHVEGNTLLTGTVTATAPAQGQSARFAFGNCLSFASASSQKCTFTTTNFLKTHSFEFWLDTADTTYSLISKIADSCDIRYDTGQLRYVTATWMVNVVQSAFSSGTKNYLVITRSGTTVKFYVNGAQVGGDKTLGGDEDFNAEEIGNKGGFDYYNGKIGSLNVYGYVLSASQILLGYNRGYGNFFFRNPPYGTQTALWNMQGSGTTESDLTGNGHTLTLINGVTRPVF